MSWAEARTGPARWTDHSHAHRVTAVWRLDGAAIHWVKVHSQARKYRQERDAYARLVPWLSDRGHRVPRCIAVDDAHRALLLTHLEGAQVALDDDAARQAAFEEAGLLLRDVHALPPDPDPMPPAEAVRLRAARWCAEAEGVVEPVVIARVAALCADQDRFAALGRVSCHRDFSPRNWLVHRGRLGLIDFEHAHTDLSLHDFPRLFDWELHTWPDVREPFFRGYGRALTDAEEQALLPLRWLYALGTVAWAAKHGDEAFESQGRAALERLRDLAG